VGANVGIGEDTGGSIRVPSSFNNLVGVCVTPGLITRTGMSPLVVFQDTAGPMARTVKDAAILLDALVGYDPEDEYTTAYLKLQGSNLTGGPPPSVLAGAPKIAGRRKRMRSNWPGTLRQPERMRFCRSCRTITSRCRRGFTRTSGRSRNRQVCRLFSMTYRREQPVVFQIIRSRGSRSCRASLGLRMRLATRRGRHAYDPWSARISDCCAETTPWR